MAKRRRDSKGRFLPKRKGRNAPSKAALRRHANAMPRDSKGRFLPKSGRRRSRSGRRRSNPAVSGIRGFPGLLVNGAIGAVTLTTSKVATRMVPQLLNMTPGTNVGLGVELAAAVAFGWLTDMVAGEDWGSWVLAGALTAPLEDAAVRWQVPFIADHVGPAGTVGVYARGRPVRATSQHDMIPSRSSASRGAGTVADWMTPFIGPDGSVTGMYN